MTTIVVILKKGSKMYCISKEQLEESLEAIGQYYCSYKSHTGQLCDCKYKTKDGKMQFGSEQFCGCPEIKLARAIIVCLTKKEYASVIKKLQKNHKKIKPKNLVAK